MTIIKWQRAKKYKSKEFFNDETHNQPKANSAADFQVDLSHKCTLCHFNWTLLFIFCFLPCSCGYFCLSGNNFCDARWVACLADHSTEIVMEMCHGKRKCTIKADVATFSKPCRPDSRKYLKVVYTCGKYH